MSEPRDDAADAPARGSAPASDPLIHDDELASALAAQMLRYSATGSIRIVPPADEVDWPAAESPAPTGPDAAPAVTLSPTPPREFDAVPVDEPEGATESAPAPELEPQPVPELELELEPELEPEPEPTTVALDLTEIIRQEEGTDFRSFAAAAGIPLDAVDSPEVSDDGTADASSSGAVAESGASPAASAGEAPTATAPLSAGSTAAAPTETALTETALTETARVEVDETDSTEAAAVVPVSSTSSDDGASGESALERALRLEPALADLTVDDATYADWEQSLLALSETSSSGVAASDEEASSPAGAAVADAPAGMPLPVTESEQPAPAPDSDDPTDPEEVPGPRRQTFTAPVPAVTGGSEAAEPGSALAPTAGDVDSPAAGEQQAPPVSETETGGPATSTIGIGTQPEGEIPADVLVATPLGAAGDEVADVVEAEVVETGDVPRPADADADAGADVTGASSEGAAPASAEPVNESDRRADDEVAAPPTTDDTATGLVPTPPRWADDAAHPFGGMARPRVPGVPSTPADIPAGPAADEDIPSAPARPVGDTPPSAVGSADDASAVSAPNAPGDFGSDTPSDAEAPVVSAPVVTPPAPEAVSASASSDYLITDTGPLTLGRGVQGPRIDTGSVPIVTGGMALDVDLDDDVDDVAAPVETLIEGDESIPIAPAEPGDHTGPIVPISTAALIAGPGMVAATSSVGSRNVSTDTGRLSYSIPTAVGTEPGPAGFGPNLLAWLAPTATVLAFALGAVLVGTGLSPLQAIAAAVIGGALGAIPLALVTRAATRSRVSAAIASRSVFGTSGAAVSSAMVLIVRVAGFAVVLWLLAGATRSLVFESGYDLFIAPDIGGGIAVGLAGVGAAVLAVLSARAVTRALWILSGLAVLSVASLVVGTALVVDLSRAVSATGGSPLTLVAGASAVLAVLAAAWTGVGADVTAQRPDGRSSTGSAFGVALGTTLPLVVLVGWGAVLAGAGAGSNPADLLATDPVAAIAQALPPWYPLPLLVAVLAPAVAGLTVLARSGGAALLSFGGRVPSLAATIASAVVGLCAAALLVVLAPGGTGVALSVAPLVAVPVLAWAGLVGVDALRRASPLDRGILTGERSGLPAVRWGALVAFLLITILGWGLLAPLSDPIGPGGWIWTVAGLTGEPIAATGLGVVAALVLGALVPLVLGRGARREDESPARATPSELLSGALDEPGARRA